MSATENGAACPSSIPVLQLDGTGACLQFPETLLDGLDDLTIEAWVNWHHLGYFSEVLGFGKLWHVLAINNREFSSDLQFFLYTHLHELPLIQIPGILRTQHWYHLAAVNSAAGMRLYVNSLLVGEHPFAGQFARLPHDRQYALGASRWPGNEDFQGQLAEVRGAWPGARQTYAATCSAA